MKPNYNVKRFQTLVESREGKSVLIVAARTGIKETPFETARMIVSQMIDNPRITTEIFGHEIISLAKTIVK